ncbi:MAG: DUF309 domain-containing protein [Campylobacterota bacterium]|nr:DUF309 domain-containing protein [Campylobacterota bacterium]
MADKDLTEFVKLIEDRSYAVAHEALEHRWRELRSVNMVESNLVKGYINAATSFELHVRGKTAQSKKVWCTFLKYRSNINSIDSVKKEMYQKVDSIILNTFNRNFNT